MEDPILKFKNWWGQALSNSPLKYKSAACVSTINKDGFPSGRFVDLKAVDEKGFTFCTSLDSTKGLDIQTNPKVALTFWWEHVSYQVRVLGIATELDEALAIEYWNSRTREAQITSSCFQQSKVLENESDLSVRFEKTKSSLGEQDIPKPDSWGAYIIAPVSIEFLHFKESRLHLRELFEVNENEWEKSLLQP